MAVKRLLAFEILAADLNDSKPVVLGEHMQNFGGVCHNGEVAKGLRYDASQLHRGAAAVKSDDIMLLNERACRLTEALFLCPVLGCPVAKGGKRLRPLVGDRSSVHS